MLLHGNGFVYNCIIWFIVYFVHHASVVFFNRRVNNCSRTDLIMVKVSAKILDSIIEFFGKYLPIEHFNIIFSNDNEIIYRQ